MATTVVLYNGDGSTTAFTYSFDSLADTYIVTSVIDTSNNTETDVTGNFTVSLDYDTSTVTLTPAPAVGERVEIKRATSTADDIFSFPAGTVMKPSDLEFSLKTVRDFAEESADQINTDLSLQTSAANASALAAAASETAAATSETNAATSATNAATSATNAATSEANAATSEATAGAHVISAAGSAASAGASATAAAGSENAAATSEANAATSETNAAASETAAAGSATAASTSATNAATSATNAAASETAAATSATNAATSATAAATSATAAATAQTNAETAETAAETAQVAAEAAQTAAESAEAGAAADAASAATSASNAATSATAAATSATNAATSETNAAGSASAAGTSANSAATSATNAAASETAAATSETDAATSATAAATSATNAATSATAAATSETNAAASETAAATSETNAGTSATAAATSATSASTSATNAATSETNAAGSATAAATSATNAATSEANAATSETNAAGSATAAATSATNAATSETNAATSETNAAASETAAATSETNAATSETNAAGSATAAATSAANAATSETNAAGSATAAATSETNAATSASNAATSETNAATSASSASSSQTAAASSATAAASSASSASSSATLAASNAAAIDLSSLSETINDTAVDVFIYDTSKDSDGGAWRHRTQHTSWYAEASSASRDPNTRSTRAEFPAVAVIVTESNKVTIYDGDDPSLPMWMVFNEGNFNNLVFGFNSLSAKNGILCSGNNEGNVNYAGLMVVRFLNDDLIGVRNSTYPKNHNSKSGVVNRNSAWPQAGSRGLIISGGGLVSALVNDVAMTVLPDAPTDPSTGLPVPTIAVATDGGVSVIKDDGTVVDSASTAPMRWVAFDGAGTLFFCTSTSFFQLYRESSFDADGFGTYTGYSGVGLPLRLMTRSERVAISGATLFTSGSYTVTGVPNSSGGIQAFALNSTAIDTSMSALTTSSYNTGWLPGDIKLAALADTDDTDLVESGELVPPSFASWLVSQPAGTTVSESGGVITITVSSTGGYPRASAPITCVVGEAYRVEVSWTNNTTGFWARIGTSPNLSGTDVGTVNDTSVSGSHTLTFVATSTTHYLNIFAEQNNTGSFDVTIASQSVKLADADRSVNNKGLIVNGSITKTAVATGADLVAYSGFDASNYLEQPYNSDLDFGTGDFCVMGWANTTDAYATFVRLGDSAGGNPKIFVGTYPSPTAGNLDAYILGTSVLRPNVLTPTGWFHWALVRTNGQATLYANSAPLVSVASTTDLSLTGTETLRIGVRHDGQQTLDAGSLALLRISATAPTADQIAKIYNDEKVLFQDSAKATLTGSSDAVTALAHDPDTNLLHVGTSGGRSVFQGLRRVNETATAVTTAISAVDGLVVEQ